MCLFVNLDVIGTILVSRDVYHQAKTTITYHFKKYHDTIYITIFYIINIHNEISMFAP